MSLKGSDLASVIDSLTTLAGNAFTNAAKTKSNQEFQTADFLMRTAMDKEARNVEQIKQLQLSLPEEYKSINFADFATRLGDDDLMSTMGEIYQIAENNNKIINQQIADYGAGAKLATTLRNQGKFGSIEGLPSQGIDDQGYYIADDDETQALIDSGEYPELSNASYLEGFKAGQMDIESAMANVQKVNQDFLVKQQINQGQIELANESNNLLMNQTGSNLIADLSPYIAITPFKGVYGLPGDENEAIIEAFSGIKKSISENMAIPNIKNAILSSMEEYAGVDGDTSGFVEMASDAFQRSLYQTQKEDEYIMVNPGASRTMARESLLESDPNYFDNDLYLKEYGSVGLLSQTTDIAGNLVTNPDLQDSYLILQNRNSINDRRLEMVAMTAGTYTEQDNLSYMDTMTDFTRPANIDNSNIDYSNVDKVFLAAKFPDLLDEGQDIDDLDIKSGDLLELSQDLGVKETTFKTAHNRFRKAADKIDQILTGNMGIMHISFPGSYGEGLSSFSPEMGSAGFGKPFQRPLPTFDEMRAIKSKITSGLGIMKGIEYGGFGEATGRPKRNVKVQIRALKAWEEYVESWKESMGARGEYIDASELLFSDK